MLPMGSKHSPSPMRHARIRAAAPAPRGRQRAPTASSDEKRESILRVAEQHGLERIVTIQNPYNLLNRSFEVNLAEFAHREQVGLLAYSPLAFGMLSGKYLEGARPAGGRLTLFERFVRYNNPQAESATAQYVALARQHGLDPAQMALAYVNSRRFLTSNIIGATTLEQLRSNIESAEVQLSDEVLAGIEAIHRKQPNPAP